MRRLVALTSMAFMACALSSCVAPDGVASIPAMPSQTSALALPVIVAQRGGARAPSGYLAFCGRNPAECGAHPGEPDRIKLSRDVWAKLDRVNRVVNAAIQPEEDSAHYGVADYWTVPVDGAGDCEDYVLAKRRMLVLLGLPEPALRITVVLDRGSIRHAVLTVVTDQGDYVLDSLKDDIRTTAKAGYVWVERQDRASPTGWVALR